MILFGNVKHISFRGFPFTALKKASVALSRVWKEAGSFANPSPCASFHLEQKLPWCLCGVKKRAWVGWSSG